METITQLEQRIKYAEYDMTQTFGRPSYAAYKLHRDNLIKRLNKLKRG